jgi:hypothetical protein
LKFKPYNLLCTNQLARISFKLPNYLVSYYSGTVAATLTLGVSQGTLDALRTPLLNHFVYPYERNITIVCYA